MLDCKIAFTNISPSSCGNRLNTKLHYYFCSWLPLQSFPVSTISKLKWSGNGPFCFAEIKKDNGFLLADSFSPTKRSGTKKTATDKPTVNNTFKPGNGHFHIHLTSDALKCTGYWVWWIDSVILSPPCFRLHAIHFMYHFMSNVCIKIKMRPRWGRVTTHVKRHKHESWKICKFITNL